MTWLVFSYSLPSKGGSSSRVTLWRRLQHLGALELTGLYILPENAETLEAFNWLAQEVEAAGGKTTLMQVQKFSSLTNNTVIEKFNAQRAKSYQELLTQMRLFQKTNNQLELSERGKTLGKLRRQFDDMKRIDFFHSPLKGQVANMLTKLEQTLHTPSPVVKITPLKVKDYQNKIWVTRPQPYIDRLACIWLIRRFIDSQATIRYHEVAKPNEISFDMPKAEIFGHQGNLCTFEVMLLSFNLKDVALQKLADIVHELDISEGYFSQSESYGLEAILKGWLRLKLSDKDLEARGIQLFEGLYQSLKEKL